MRSCLLLYADFEQKSRLHDLLLRLESVHHSVALSTNWSSSIVSASSSSAHIADHDLLSPPKSSKEPPEGAFDQKIALISLYYNIVLIKVSITTTLRMELSTWRQRWQQAKQPPAFEVVELCASSSIVSSVACFDFKGSIEESKLSINRKNCICSISWESRVTVFLTSITLSISQRNKWQSSRLKWKRK